MITKPSCFLGAKRAVFTLALAATAMVANAASLLPSTVADQVPTLLVPAPLPATDRSEREPVDFAWALDPQQSVQPATAEPSLSRGYWQQVDGAQLQRGIRLPLTTPDAVIQLSPATDARRLRPIDVELRDPSGRRSGGPSVEARQLQAEGMPVTDGSWLLRSGEDTKAGVHTLRSANALGTYVVQVVEPGSTLQLAVRAKQNQVLAGGDIAVQAELRDNAAEQQKLLKVRRATLRGEALLVAPDGQSWPQPLRHTRDGGLAAQVRIPANAPTTPGLWELQVFTRADGVLRDGKVAFAVARPTARFAGTALTDAGNRRIDLPVEVAAAGRYEARGTLYATDADGLLRPVARAHTAAWFGQAGNGNLALAFDQVGLPTGFGAPFELRDLQLHDQSRMAPIESRGLALRF